MLHSRRLRVAGGFAILCVLSVAAVRLLLATPLADVRARVRSDGGAGRPLVAHVVVALCDNENQGIVRVPEHLGNGQDPHANLYWGAAYGVRTYFTRSAAWRLAAQPQAPTADVLEKVVMHSPRTAGRASDYFVVAEAWDGRKMADAVARFLRLAAGRDAEEITLPSGAVVTAGGAAHLVVFVGHNGLMDAPAETVPDGARRAAPRASAVLACASRSYFLNHLERGESYPLLLTTGLMAPEAYTLDAMVREWFAQADPASTCLAAARAYDRFQHCGVAAAKRLFGCGQ